MENIDASGSEPESWRRFSSKNREESQVTRTKRQKDKKTKDKKTKKEKKEQEVPHHHHVIQASRAASAQVGSE